jgi:hypothetical protein
MASVKVNVPCLMCSTTKDTITNSNRHSIVHTAQEKEHYDEWIQHVLSAGNSVDMFKVCPLDNCCYWADPNNFKHYADSHSYITMADVDSIDGGHLALDLFIARSQVGKLNLNAQYFLINSAQLILNCLIHSTAYNKLSNYISSIQLDSVTQYNDRQHYTGSEPQLYIVIHNYDHHFTNKSATNQFLSTGRSVNLVMAIFGTYSVHFNVDSLLYCMGI